MVAIASKNLFLVVRGKSSYTKKIHIITFYLKYFRDEHNSYISNNFFSKNFIAIIPDQFSK